MITSTTKRLTVKTAGQRRALDATVQQVYEEQAKKSLALIAREAEAKDGDPDWVTRNQVRNLHFTVRNLHKKVLAAYRHELQADLAPCFVSIAQIRGSLKRLTSKESGNVVQKTTEGGSGSPTGTLIWFSSFHSRTLHQKLMSLGNRAEIEILKAQEAKKKANA